MVCGSGMADIIGPREVRVMDRGGLPLEGAAIALTAMAVGM
jgi:hypothetical protein